MVSASASFLFAVVLYPAVQKKAQVEIDTITHGSRLPEFSDRKSLPYLDAIMHEVLRWKPIDWPDEDDLSDADHG
jgi:cytochrome P450